MTDEWQQGERGSCAKQVILTIAATVAAALLVAVLGYCRDVAGFGSPRSDDVVEVRDMCNCGAMHLRYLDQLRNVVDEARSHKGSTNLLQGDIDRLAELAGTIEGGRSIEECEEMRSRSLSAGSAAAQLLEAFREGRSGDAETVTYTQWLWAAEEEQSRILSGHACP